MGKSGKGQRRLSDGAGAPGPKAIGIDANGFYPAALFESRLPAADRIGHVVFRNDRSHGIGRSPRFALARQSSFESKKQGARRRPSA
jgi:hypothetical protein